MSVDKTNPSALCYRIGLGEVWRGFLFLLAAFTLVSGRSGAAADDSLFARADEIPELLTQGKLTPEDIPSPHWRDDGCHACHAGAPNTKPVKLRDRSADKVCHYCHDPKYEHSYIHPVDIRPDDAMIARMPPSYRRSVEGSGGSMTCLTCHDLLVQCLPERRNQQGLNPTFFRSGPFRVRSKQCYFCHDAKQYKRLNPHDQVSDDGHLQTDTCRICHSDDVGRLQTTRGIANLHFYGEGDLSLLCIRCHPVKPHPNVTFKFGAEHKPPDHLVKPSSKKMRHMQKQTEINKVELPLEPDTGRIFCGTCHNPHEQGVVKNVTDRIGAENRKKRLRADRICQFCHDV